MQNQLNNNSLQNQNQIYPTSNQQIIGGYGNPTIGGGQNYNNNLNPQSIGSNTVSNYGGAPLNSSGIYSGVQNTANQGSYYNSGVPQSSNNPIHLQGSGGNSNPGSSYYSNNASIIPSSQSIDNPSNIHDTARFAYAL